MEYWLHYSNFSQLCCAKSHNLSRPIRTCAWCCRQVIDTESKSVEMSFDVSGLVASVSRASRSSVTWLSVAAVVRRRRRCTFWRYSAWKRRSRSSRSASCYTVVPTCATPGTSWTSSSSSPGLSLPLSLCLLCPCPLKYHLIYLLVPLRCGVGSATEGPPAGTNHQLRQSTKAVIWSIWPNMEYIRKMCRLNNTWKY